MIVLTEIFANITTDKEVQKLILADIFYGFRMNVSSREIIAFLLANHNLVVTPEELIGLAKVVTNLSEENQLLLGVAAEACRDWLILVSKQNVREIIADWMWAHPYITTTIIILTIGYLIYREYRDSPEEKSETE